jgi:hypothetical protein
MELAVRSAEGWVEVGRLMYVWRREIGESRDLFRGEKLCSERVKKWQSDWIITSERLVHCSEVSRSERGRGKDP